MKKSILLLINLLVFAICTMAQFQNGKNPMMSDTLLFEDWSSGSFITNQWQLSTFDSSALTITNVDGNPPPSAKFILYEFFQVGSMTSKEITGTNNYTELRYDIYLSDSSNSAVGFVAEIWDGVVWHSMDVVDGNGGSFPWTTRVVNISDYCHNNFKIRFRAYSNNLYSDHLDIDNIIVGSFPLGITEHQTADFIIKPNPAHSSIDLVLNNFENLNTKIIILDVTGKVVYDEEFIPGTIDYIKKVNINTLSKGIYFCEIKSIEKNLIRKLIIE